MARRSSLARIAWFVLALGSLAATAAELSAQGVRGVVLDSAQRALVDAEIILGNGLERVRSDSNGTFHLGTGLRGKQRVRVRLIGYRPFETNVTITEQAWTDLRVALTRMPQLLAEVRITDRNECAPTTIAGFECRRRAGGGLFRDAGEIRSLRPDAWADMFDGMPGLRRVPMMTPDGLDWRPGVAPSRCLRWLYNGHDPMFNGNVKKIPEGLLVTRDVIAIEYYQHYRDVPDVYQRFAWPKEEQSPCGLIVYWLREAPAKSKAPSRKVTIRP
ncbi:MAG: carboxypeptidase-like regulatory domain-containing protein [Gemmatimonadaceae bacterium]|nr:carboxypeptidase-like regulatory domain-containing protein [Gemmatimonadaceae bacterium]